jgi:hypothetical protein
MFKDLGAVVAVGTAGTTEVAAGTTEVAAGAGGTAVGAAVGEAHPPKLPVTNTQKVVRLSSLFPMVFTQFLLRYNLIEGWKDHCKILHQFLKY